MTQRGLSRKLSLSVSVTNFLVRSLISKGYVRAIQAGWKSSLAYSLTPTGMKRRVHLVRGYVRRVLGTYRSMRESFARELSAAGFAPGSRVAIYCPDSSGSTRELAELIFLALKDQEVKRIHFVGDEEAQGMKVVGVPVRPLAAPPYDWVIVASLDGSPDGLRFPGVAEDRVVLPLRGSDRRQGGRLAVNGPR